VISKEIREGSERVGFELINISTGDRGVLAHIKALGPSIGKYKVNLKGIEEVAAHSIEEALTKKNILIIDEIGPMELLSKRFVDAVDRAFEDDVNILATIHFRSNHPLVLKLKQSREVELIVMDLKNREEVFQKILKRII
jgi:nucleoside-triphosphatase